MTACFPLTYPDSPTYSESDFDAVARAYCHEGRSAPGASGVMSCQTARRFLRQNGLYVDLGRGEGTRRHYAYARRERQARVATLARFGHRPDRIAEKIGVSRRSVFRLLAGAREAGLL